jgi:predicted Holliday junction resolvase-like endonuclease
MDLVLVVLFLALVVLVVLVFFLLKRVFVLESALRDLEFSKFSQSVKYGKMSENFIPFVKDFPFNPENFRFLGNPVDGIVFEDDKIIFVEFKSGSGQLSSKQKLIKDLVEHKKVEWFEFRIR